LGNGQAKTESEKKHEKQAKIFFHKHCIGDILSRLRTKSTALCLAFIAQKLIGSHKAFFLFMNDKFNSLEASIFPVRSTSEQSFLYRPRRT